MTGPGPRRLRDKWMLLAAAGFAAVILVLILRNPYAGPSDIPPPVQELRAVPETIQHEGKEGPVRIDLLADYRISAAVKGRQPYSTDIAAQVSPLDLVLAWGAMNQPDVDAHISYSQSGRWYHLRYDEDVPVTPDYITENTANVHLIPSDGEIASRLEGIRVNDYVTLEGQLVKVYFTAGTWTSSLSRQDSGDGACEILYVTRVRIG